MPEPLPPLTRADSRYQPSGLRYSADYGRSSYRNDYLGTPADALQNSRIDALEQMLRGLSHDFSNERHIIAGLVRDLSRDTLAHQDDQGRGQAVLIDRIGALEAMLRDGGASGSVETLPLVSKLENIEAALELRLQEMSQSWAVLSTRLQELEASVRARPASDGVVDSEAHRRSSRHHRGGGARPRSIAASATSPTVSRNLRTTSAGCSQRRRMPEEPMHCSAASIKSTACRISSIRTTDR